MQHAMIATWRGVVAQARRRRAAWRLHREMGHRPDLEIDRALRALGKARRDLFTVFAGNAPHRNLMACMIAHFRVDLDLAVPAAWSALRDAERACARCANRGRCRRWFAWAAQNDAPRVFCPNAALFDSLATKGRGPGA